LADRKVRPTYSPRMPRIIDWTPPTSSTTTIRDAQPEGVLHRIAGHDGDLLVGDAEITGQWRQPALLEAIVDGNATTARGKHIPT
jgi:hypothetical protein